jgi:hypothetical protein
VDAERLWGAQTERSRRTSGSPGERMPRELVHALVLVKKAAALVHVELGVLDAAKGRAIVAAADEVLAGRWDSEFPLVVWQTGSGTQTNMNVNEVLANRASEILGGERGEKRLVPPERRRQPRPVHERRLPHRDPRGRHRRSAPRGDPGARGAPRHAARQGRGLRRRRQDRPHAPDGRDAAHARAGDLRLGAAARAGRGAARAGAAGPPGAGARRHRRRHRPQRAPRARPARRAEARRAHRPSLRRRPRTSSRRSAGATRSSRPRGAADGGRVALQDRERRAAARLGSALRHRRDRDPRTSRAARSCRAR